MGLSNDERYAKVFYTLNGLRETLKDDWADRQLKELTYYLSDLREVVNKIDDSTRQLTGMVFQWFDTNGGYWLFGENEHGFRGYHADSFWAKDKRDDDIFKRVDEELSRILSFEQFVKRAGFDKKLVLLAKWWELYSYVPALLYPVKRYDDDAFDSQFKSELNRLLSYISDLKPEADEQSEKVILLKYRSFYDECTKGMKNLDYEKQDACLKKFVNMTQKELEDLVREKRDEKFAWRKKYDEEQAAKKGEKVDPVYGLLPKDDEVVNKPVAAKKKKK